MTGLDPVILGFLRWGPRNGYQIKKSVDKSVGHFWTVSFGGLYPALTRLLEHGDIVEVEPENATGSVYAITPRGETKFKKWHQSSANQIVSKDDFMLKIHFARDEELSQLAGHVAKRLAEVTEKYKTLLDIKATEYERLSIGIRFNLDKGISSYETELRLLQDLYQQCLKPVGIEADNPN